MRKKRYSLFIILAAIIWSTDGLLRRHLSALPPSYIVLIEYIIRLVIVLPFIPRFMPEFKKMTRKDWTIMIILGITSGVLAKTLYTAALGMVNDITYSVVSLLQQTQPIFAVILAVLILKERLTKRYGIFAIIALAAAYFLTFPHYMPTFISGSGELIASILALGAALAWGAGTVLSKLLLGKLSYAALSIMRFIIVVPVILILNIGLQQTYPLSAITSTQWSYLFLIALTSGTASFFLYYKGLQHTEVKISTFAEFAWPISAALFGYFLLGERLTAVQWIAGAVLLVNILALSFSSAKES